MKLTPRHLSLAEIFDRENNSPLALMSADTSALDATKVSAGNAPDSILLIPWGSQPDPLGYLEVNRETVATLAKVQTAMDLLRVPIYDPGDPTKQENSDSVVEEPFQVGSGRVTARDKDGIYLVEIQWLDKGLEALAEFGFFKPTVWLTGDLANAGSKSIVGVKSVQFSQTANAFVMLDLPKLINLSAMAQNAGYNRLLRCMSAENVDDTTDRVKLIKQFAANGKFPRHDNGALITEHEMRVLDARALRALYERTPQVTPNDQEKIIRTFSALGRFPKKPDGQVCTVEDLKSFDLKFLKILYANIVNSNRR